MFKFIDDFRIEMMSEDLSNKTLAKLLSVEFLLPLIPMVFAGGIAYATLTNAQDVTETKVDKIEMNQIKIKDSVQSIEISVAEIKTGQKAQVETAKKQQKDIDRILDILERRFEP